MNQRKKEWQNKRRKNYKEDINKYKSKIGKCQICEWNEHYEILEFHHKDKDKKKFKFSVGSLGNYSKKIIEEEMNKCLLICPNCHKWIHYNEREWFLQKASKAGNSSRDCRAGHLPHE